MPYVDRLAQSWEANRMSLRFHLVGVCLQALSDITGNR